MSFREHSKLFLLEAVLDKTELGRWDPAAVGTDSSAILVARGPGGLHGPCVKAGSGSAFRGKPRSLGYPGTSWRVLPGVRGRAVVACNAIHKAGRWAGSRTALEVLVPQLRSYVGFGVHQIEFATTHSHTHSLAHARSLLALLHSHTTIVFWNNLPGLPCFAQPVRHPQRPCRCPKLCLLLSSALHVTVAPTQRAHHQG